MSTTHVQQSIARASRSPAVPMIEYTISNVAAGTTSGEEELFVPFRNGQILTIDLVTASEDYDISIRQRSGVTSPSIHERIIVTDIDEFEYDDAFVDTPVYFYCVDTTTENKLYFVLTNNGLIDTGEFQMIIVYKEI